MFIVKVFSDLQLNEFLLILVLTNFCPNIKKILKVLKTVVQTHVLHLG